MRVVIGPRIRRRRHHQVHPVGRQRRVTRILSTQVRLVERDLTPEEIRAQRQQAAGQFGTLCTEPPERGAARPRPEVAVLFDVALADLVRELHQYRGEDDGEQAADRRRLSVDEPLQDGDLAQRMRIIPCRLRAGPREPRDVVRERLKRPASHAAGGPLDVPALRGTSDARPRPGDL